MRLALPFIVFALVGCGPSTIQPSSNAVRDGRGSRFDDATPLALVEWNEEASAFLCRSTGTRLSVPDPAGPIQHLGDDSVALVGGPPDASGVLLVRASRAESREDAFFSDWAELHRLIGAPLATDATIAADVEFDESTVTIEYTVQTGASRGSYKLGYRVFQRNGVSCRFAALERADAGTTGAVATLDRISDTPGLEITSPPPRGVTDCCPAEAVTDPAWAFLRGALNLAAALSSPKP